MVSIKRKEIKKKVSEKLGAFIREDVKTKDLKNLERLIFLIALLALALTGLQLNRAQSYRKYERIRFTSAGATLYANLYYPTKNLSFQEKRPLLIFCHGIGSKRDFDLRIPIEFTKRGFYVAALDYQGHGESGGNINNIDPHLDPIDSPGPALAQDCTKLLEKLKTMAFYSNVNTSQIGLIGHSLGGLVVLMNQALNPEFKYTVAWAPLVNFVPPQFGLEWQGYENFIPVNLLNSNNTDNLLIIMHTQDEVLDFKANALKAKQLTNCTVINITKPLLGGGHQLFSNEVLAYSIRWFEEHFFNSSVKNGPISISFIWNYILIILNLVLLIFIISLLISQSSKYFHLKPELIDQDKKKGKRIVVELKKISKVALILIYSSLFIINWQIFTTYFGVIGIFYASLLFSAAFLLVKGIKYFWRFKKEKVESMRKA
ncbi:MAG: alpha/beta hydrolase family protein, partial [Promethearchaeota archaeon]